MCGIAGLITKNRSIPIEERLGYAERVQMHRGPDAQGTMKESIEGWQVGLSHQRLSIIDLSLAGNQPMMSSDRSGIIIYNGEVYNYRDIRDELSKSGYTFTSDSDTEIVLEALHNWGPTEAFNRFNGMWALAWLDKRNRKLILSRDRVGVKPLYYYLSNDTFYFASELKGILAMTSEKFGLNMQVVGEYIVQSLLETSEETFFDGIKKVPANHYVIIDLTTDNLQMEFVRYWTFPRQDLLDYSEDELVEKIRGTFIDSVRLRLRSDVPVGVLLSGGIDSSSIAAVMRMILGRNINLNLLSAVSKDGRFDESPFIDIMAEHLGCKANKVDLDLSPEQAFELLEQVCWHNDEPVSSFSNVAQYMLMRHAKELGITVILSGQGADELLCGYSKYLWFYLQHLVCNGQFLKAKKVFSDFWRQGTILKQFSLSEAKRYLPPSLRPSEINVCGSALNEFRPVSLGMNGCNSISERQCRDVEKFSVPVLVHYEDRMSMAWSREIRTPFLDYRLIEMLLPLRIEHKLSKGWTKYIFRRALGPLLPNEITWRKDKSGFTNPEGEWLRNELKDKIIAFINRDNILYEKNIVKKANFINKYYSYMKESHNKGNIFYREIFNVIALEIWARKYNKWIS